MGEIQNILGDFIRARRVQQGFSLRGLADRTGLSASFLSDVERGNRTLSVAAAFTLAKHLPGLNPEWVLHRQIDVRVQAMKRELRAAVERHEKESK